MIEVVLNDRLGKKVKYNVEDTIGGPQEVGGCPDRDQADNIRIQKWYNTYKDHITLKDYEIHDGIGLEPHYN